MDSIEKLNENYAVVFNINLLRATLNEASEFKDYLAQAILESDKDIIVNLSNCEHLDSTFLGVLVSSFKKLKTQNRNLLIIEPTDKSSIFLTLNSIGKIFPLYSSVNSALEDLENKKILESEINELDDDGKKKDKSYKKTTAKSFKKPVVQSREEPVPENIIPTKFPQIENVKSEKEELQINPALKEKELSEFKPELIENKNNKVEIDNTLNLNSDEQPTILKISSRLDAEEDKFTDTTISKSKTVSKDKKIKGERIEWEFGFN
ncbi:MAG: STAS domain-containing protein [Ignavibacteriaceae bacterium]